MAKIPESVMRLRKVWIYLKEYIYALKVYINKYTYPKAV